MQLNSFRSGKWGTVVRNRMGSLTRKYMQWWVFSFPKNVT